MPLRVLVVDDEPFIRMNLADALGAAGMVVTEACDAVDALDQLKLSTFDFVVSDVRMPGQLDGWDLANHVRTQWPSTQVLLMSGHFERGALPSDIAFIRKPFSMGMLIAQLASKATPH